jgi:hypothetical protein
MSHVRLGFDDTNVIVGAFYELPDGRIAYTVQWDGVARAVGFHCDGCARETVSEEEFGTWVLRSDLRDFPNAIDPRLPYEFDLWWDIKQLSELREALATGHEDAEDMRDLAQRCGIDLSGGTA